jgi:hypothetical protein
VFPLGGDVSRGPQSCFDLLSEKTDCSAKPRARQLSATRQLVDGRPRQGEERGDFGGGHHVFAREVAAPLG